MASGNGKIANLPREIREQLNWRINDDVAGIDLVEWLNAKPEVQAVMMEHYDGRPISEQNLSEWRKCGYQKWLSLHIVLDEAHAISEDADQIAETGVNCEKLLLALTASYGAMIQNWNVMPAEQLIYKMGIFKNLTNAILSLRRAEVQKVRLQFERERLELLREKQRNKSASSSSTRVSSSSENTPQSDPAHSATGAQSGKAVSPMPPIHPTQTPPPRPSQSPVPSSPSPAPHPTAAIATVSPNAGSPWPDEFDSEPPTAASPVGAPRTSTPRNLRGLL